ncbi:MAG: 5-methylthioadenosine/S-adenosylhomocysteine deaminase [Candidatus Endobugula sp.]|jgi:5-methylthioadenosine/S-adenosylhomocysteine deaminase
MTIKTVDLIIHAKWILPVIPQNTLQRDCSLVVDKQRIIAIKPTDNIHQLYRGDEEYQLDHHVLMPGLINAHGHTAMSLLRGYADDVGLDTWLNDHIWPTEAKYVSEEFVKDGAELAMAEMIRSGTTCFSDMYFFPEATAAVAHAAGMRCQITFPIFDFPCAWGNGPDDYVSKGLALRDDYRNHERITVIFGPHAPYTVGDETFTRIANLASEIQCGIHVHLHETKGEVETALNVSGKRPIQRLFDLQVLTPTTQCVHMTQVNDDDIALLQQTGAHIIHCPESNLKLASGFCPVDKLLNAGINVALGTDSAASNNNLDMFGEMHTAALLGKAVAEDATALNAQQVIEMATINGAKAMGIDDDTGSLEVGKYADVIAIALDDIEHALQHDILSQIMYTHNGHRVSHSWVNGQLLMQNRELTTLNINDIANKSMAWQKRMT